MHGGGWMMMNLKLDGLSEEVVNIVVSRGIASNKTEAIRLMVLHYNEHFGIRPMNSYLEDALAVRKMQKIDREIDAGRRKVLNAKEALGKYAKYLK